MPTLQQKHRARKIQRATEAREKAKVEKLLATQGPIAYGYGRISHKEQEDKGSVDRQGRQIQKFYEGHLEDEGVAWGGFFGEPGHVSASKVKFMRRPAGKRLCSLLKPGDHLIVDKIDRLWRSIHDFSTLLEWFKKHDITIHFVNMMGCSVSLGTPMGDFMLGLTVLYAQLEAAQMSDRIKGQLDYKMEQGYWPRAVAPIGTKKVGPKGKRRLVWDQEEREWMAEIVRLREQEGLGVDLTLARIDAMYRERHGLRPDEPLPESFRFRHRKNITRGYIYEQHYRLVAEPMHADFKAMDKCPIKQAREIGEKRRRIEAQDKLLDDAIGEESNNVDQS